MAVKPVTTRKLRRRPNDPVPVPEKRGKPSPDILCARLYEVKEERQVERVSWKVERFLSHLVMRSRVIVDLQEQI